MVKCLKSGAIVEGYDTQEIGQMFSDLIWDLPYDHIGIILYPLEEPVQMVWKKFLKADPLTEWEDGYVFGGAEWIRQHRTVNLVYLNEIPENLQCIEEVVEIYPEIWEIL